MKAKYMQIKHIVDKPAPAELYNMIRRQYIFSSKPCSSLLRAMVRPYCIITDGRDFFALPNNNALALGAVFNPTGHWILPIPSIKNKKFDKIIHEQITKIILNTELKINGRPITAKDIQIYDSKIAFYNAESNAYHIVYFIVLNPKSIITIKNSDIIMIDIYDTLTLGIKSGFLLSNNQFTKLDLVSLLISAFIVNDMIQLPVVDTGDDYAWNKRLEANGKGNLING